MANYLLGELMVKLGIMDKDFTAGTQAATSSLSSMGKQALGTALGFAGVGGITAALNMAKDAVVASVKAYADFEKKMAEVSTLVDTSTVDMGKLEQGVKELSLRYGKDPSGLAGALYEVVSAGIDAKDAISFLRVATEASIGGVTDVRTVVDGLTSVLAAYGMEASKASEVSDSLFVAIKVGKTTMAEIAPAIGQVASISATAGLKLDEMNSALAALTLSGLSTSEAATALRGVMVQLISPSKDALKLARELGIDFSVAGLKAKGFSGFLEDLRNKTGRSSEAMGVLFGDIRGLNGALQLTGNAFARYNQTMEEMGNKTGIAEQAAGKMKDTLSFKWDVFTTGVKDAGIALADNLAPAMSALLGLANDIVGFGKTNVFKDFNKSVQNGTGDIAEMEKTLKRAREELRKAIEEKQALIGTGRGDYEQIYQGEGFEPKQTASPVIDQLNKVIEKTEKAIEIVKKKKEADEAANKAEEEKLKKQLAAQEAKATAAAKALMQDQNQVKARQESIDAIDRLEAKVAQNRIKYEAAAREAYFANKKEVVEAQIADIEKIMADEKLSAEEKKRLAVDVSNKKIELLAIDRDSRQAANAATYESEKANVIAVQNEIQKQYAALDKAYSAHNGKVTEGSQKEYDAKKALLDKQQTDTTAMLQNVESDYKKSAENIEKEFGIEVIKETTATIKIRTEIEQGTFDLLWGNINKNYRNWLDELQQGSTSAWSGAVRDAGDAIKAIGLLFGGLPDVAGVFINDFVGLISSGLSGNPIQMATSALTLIGHAIMGAGDNSKESAKQMQIASENAITAAKAFLKAAGKEDLTLMSAEEISERIEETGQSIAAFLKTSPLTTGVSNIGKLKPEQLVALQGISEANMRTAIGYAGAKPYEELSAADKAQVDIIKEMLGTIGGEGGEAAGVAGLYEIRKAIQINPELQTLLSTYQTRAKALPTATSQAPEQALIGATRFTGVKNALDRMLAAGTISEYNYYQELYKYAKDPMFRKQLTNAAFDQIQIDAARPKEYYEPPKEQGGGAWKVVGGKWEYTAPTETKPAGGTTQSFTAAEQGPANFFNSNDTRLSRLIDYWDTQLLIGKITPKFYHDKLFDIANEYKKIGAKVAQYPAIQAMFDRKHFELRKKAVDAVNAAEKDAQEMAGAGAGAGAGTAALQTGEGYSFTMGNTGSGSGMFINSLTQALSKFPKGQIVPDDIHITVDVTGMDTANPEDIATISTAIADGIKGKLLSQGAPTL